MLDRLLGAAALVVLLLLFVWIAIPATQRGIDSADDAYFAEFAKTLAIGRGYGLPLGSEAIDAFAPGSGSGPALMVPLAIVIRIVGPFDTLPGSVTLAGFLLLVGLVGLILGRRFGWAAACGFLAALLLGFGVVLREYFVFGTFLGEAWTLAWLLVGAAVLSTAERRRAVAAGGVALSLAYLTKQVGLFGAGAIAVAWLALLAGSRVGRRAWLERAAVLVAAGLVLPAAYELVKLVTLGPAGYLHLKRAELVEAGLPGGHASTDLVATVHALLDHVYQGAALLILLALASVVLVLVARRSATTPLMRAVATRGTWLWLVLWAGVAGQLVHFAWSRSDWPRYLWPSVALTVAAAATPVLMLRPRLRAALMAGALGIVAFVMVTRPPWPDPFSPGEGHRERMAIIAWLDARPDLPYAGMGWTQVHEVAFSRPNEGRWSGSGVRAFTGSPFAMIVNPAWLVPSEKASPLFQTTMRSCEPQLTDMLRQRHLLLCGDAFWDAYVGEVLDLGAEGGTLDSLDAPERYAAGPDASVSAADDAPPGLPGPSVRLAVTGIPPRENRSAMRTVSADLSALPDDALLRVWVKASTLENLGVVYLLVLSDGAWAPMGVTPTAAGIWEEFTARKGDIPVSTGFDWSTVTGLQLRVDAAAAPYSGEVLWRDLRLGGEAGSPVAPAATTAP